MNNLDKFMPLIEIFSPFGYLFGFLAALFETTMGFGLFVPGSTIIVLLAAISAEGYFHLEPLILFVITGGILGDALNYFLGRKLGSSLEEKGFFLLKPSTIKKGKEFFLKYGNKSVFISRFIPGLRETVPLIAGVFQMEKKSFFIFNLLAACIWGTSWCLTGYYLNKNLKVSKLIFTKAGIFIALLLILFILLRLLKILVINKENSNFFSFIKNRFRRDGFWGLSFTLLATSLLFVILLFGGVTEDVLNSEAIVLFDAKIADLLYYFRNDDLVHFFLWITLLGKSEIVATFSLTVISLLWIWREKLFILPFLIGLIGTSGLISVEKFLFHRSRPENAIYMEKGFSFPSGHAAISIFLYGFIFYLVLKHMKQWIYKVNIVFLYLTLVLFIGFSRIYLGVHYLSDILGGYLTGAFWLIISIGFSEYLSFDNKLEQKFDKNKFFISLAVIFSALSFYIICALNYNPL